MASNAFEMITTRFAWYAAEDIAKYEPVAFDLTGKLIRANGTGNFIGICQYGAAAGELATVVRGVYPAKIFAAATAGTRLTPSSYSAGSFTAAGYANKVVAVLLTDAETGGIAPVAMLDGAPADGTDTCVSIVTFNPTSGGTYTAGTTTIALSCALYGATIEYSLDGGTTWLAYTEAIATTGWTGSKTVKARATKTGYFPSVTSQATYTAA